MSLEEHRKKSPGSVKVIVMTVSDTRTKETDETGKIIKELLEKNSHVIVDYQIIENDREIITNFIENELTWYRSQAIIFNGGTGISSKDMTVEIVEKLLDKKLHGFGEFFRYLSYKEIGPAAMLSRSMAGVAGSTLIICLPGSPKAAKLAMEKLILSEIGHMVMEIMK
ncbi:MAG TPA: molybdenum cofactor biosynthesis protein B [Candidatus Eremiobacteraeota bacterium]|nr:MAG: Molybdenum cofactor biosynthesis protein B [bacterium ADurb.Bin363]HPZ08896.1 molybdenum cofactor biosynthesis protein B [Candidatus Eremiobacteraeota bacterium]